MSIPITLGSLKTNINDMQVGDYIAVRYTADNITSKGVYSELGTVDTELNEDVSNISVLEDGAAIDGFVYCIKIDKGILVPANYLYMTGSYSDTVANYYNGLNMVDLIYGYKINISNNTFLLRVPNKNEIALMTSTLNGMVNPSNYKNNFGLYTYEGSSHIIFQESLTTNQNWCFDNNTYTTTAKSGLVKCVLIYNESGKPDNQVNLY